MTRIALLAVVLLAAGCPDLSTPTSLYGKDDLAGASPDGPSLDQSGLSDGGGPPDLRPPQTFTVMVGPAGTRTFEPQKVTIHVGDTVKWVWASGNHNVVSGIGMTADGLFCSPSDNNCSFAPVSNVGFTYSHTFRTAGLFPYFCKPHISQGMAGAVDVQ